MSKHIFIVYIIEVHAMEVKKFSLIAFFVHVGEVSVDQH